MVDKLNQAHSLISEYQRLYQHKFGEKPIMNRNKLKYLLVDILRDLSTAQVKELMAYYIEIEAQPSLLSFCYDYAELYEMKARNERDADERKRLMRETERRTKEFRERYGK
jgi:hypothetical protein